MDFDREDQKKGIIGIIVIVILAGGFHLIFNDGKYKEFTVEAYAEKMAEEEIKDMNK